MRCGSSGKRGTGVPTTPRKSTHCSRTQASTWPGWSAFSVSQRPPRLLPRHRKAAHVHPQAHQHQAQTGPHSRGIQPVRLDGPSQSYGLDGATALGLPRGDQHTTPREGSRPASHAPFDGCAAVRRSTWDARVMHDAAMDSVRTAPVRHLHGKLRGVQGRASASQFPTGLDDTCAHSTGLKPAGNLAQ